MYGADQVRCVWRGIPYSSSFLEGFGAQRRSTSDVQMLDLGRYRQMDDYSCGFIAALAVVRYYRPEVEPHRLLSAVRPTYADGCDEPRLLGALRRFGVRVRRRRGLTAREVFAFLRDGKPVIVLVDLPALGTDHWAVIRGYDRSRRRVYLVNHGSWDRPGIDWRAFRRAWQPAGLGWVCSG